MRSASHKDSSKSRSYRQVAARSKTEKKEPFFNHVKKTGAPGMRVSQPGDRQEIQADRSADRVVERLSTPFFKPSPGINEMPESVGRAVGNEPLDRQSDESVDDTAPVGAQRSDIARRQKSEPVSTFRQEEEKEAHVSRRQEATEDSAVMRQKEEKDEVQLSRQAEQSEDVSAQRQEEEEEVQLSRQAMEPAVTREEETEKTQLSRQHEESKEPSVSRQQEDEVLQARANGPARATVELQHQITESKGRGQKLSLAAQAEFGAAFGGRDFSNIRIHTGTEAARLSADLNARAFAHGQDIYFSEGRFNPDTREGQHLLAHELTHSIQTGNAPLASADAHGSFIADLLEQIKLSNREAKEAEDPRPAAEARKTAEDQGKKALSDAQRESADAKGDSTEPQKPANAEPRIAEVNRRAPGRVKPVADAPPRGEVGQYLAEKSADVCNQGAAKSQRLADNESAHDPAGQKLDQTEAAVKPPQKENQSRNEAAQVRTVQSAGDPGVLPDANHAALDTAIEASVPESIEELNEFESGGKGKARLSATPFSAPCKRTLIQYVALTRRSRTSSRPIRPQPPMHCRLSNRRRQRANWISEKMLCLSWPKTIPIFRPSTSNQMTCCSSSRLPTNSWQWSTVAIWLPHTRSARD